MASLLRDWCDFCEGVAEFDKSHFLALFKEHSSADELHKIFRYFPCADELQKRAETVFMSGTLEGSAYLLPLADERRSVEDLISKANSWLKEQCLFCKNIGDDELYDISHNAVVEYTTRNVVDAALNSDSPTVWIFELIGDKARATRCMDGGKVYALFEALYGIAADYYLAWYIAAPLMSVDINFECYFEFWRQGGVGALCNNKLLVSYAV